MLNAILLRDVDLYVPEKRGRGSVLTIDGKIAAVGALDPARVETSLAAIDVQLDVIDAHGLAVLPGLIDPHEHLLGSSGERGFSSRAPEIFCVELTAGGITTVVGTLGTDNTMRTMSELLAKVKALEEEGLTAYMYSGGYTLPPVTVMNSLRNDLLFISHVIGAGEIAISDSRALQPEVRALASVITEASVGGLLSRKAVRPTSCRSWRVRCHPAGCWKRSFPSPPATPRPCFICRKRGGLSRAAMPISWWFDRAPSSLFMSSRAAVCSCATAA